MAARMVDLMAERMAVQKGYHLVYQLVELMETLTVEYSERT
jgi:hypothetical protein